MPKDNKDFETDGRNESKDSSGADLSVHSPLRTATYGSGTTGASQVGAPFDGNPYGVRK